MAKAQVKKAVAVKGKTIALPKDSVVSPQEMLGKVVMLVMRCHHFQAQRRIREDQIKAEDAEKGWVKGQKQLMDSPKLKEINRVLHEARAWLKAHALPSPIADSVYFIPDGVVERAEIELIRLKKKHGDLVDQFAEEEYEQGVKDAKKALGKLFDQKDYVGKEFIRSLFGMDWEYKSVEVPVKLEKLSEKLFKRELAKAEKQGEEAARIWKEMLRQEFAGVVSHMVERLTPSKDGKKKIFRDTVLTNMDEWVMNFNPRNIQNDAQLKTLVDKAKGLLKGTNPETLRDDEAAREQVRQQFQTLKNTLDTMVAVKPSREVSFDED